MIIINALLTAMVVVLLCAIIWLAKSLRTCYKHMVEYDNASPMTFLGIVLIHIGFMWILLSVIPVLIIRYII